MSSKLPKWNILQYIAAKSAVRRLDGWVVQQDALFTRKHWNYCSLSAFCNVTFSEGVLTVSLFVGQINWIEGFDFLFLCQRKLSQQFLTDTFMKVMLHFNPCYRMKLECRLGGIHWKGNICCSALRYNLDGNSFLHGNTFLNWCLSSFKYKMFFFSSKAPQEIFDTEKYSSFLIGLLATCT